MMWKTHLVFGLLAASFAFSFFHSPWYVFFPLAALGALLPDIDHEGSKINKLLPVTRWVSKFFAHRGFFHSIFPVLILYFAFKYFGLLSIGIPLCIGYVAHLASDCLTHMGIGLLHPVLNLRIEGFLKTGGFTETAIFLVVLAGTFFRLIRLF